MSEQVQNDHESMGASAASCEAALQAYLDRMINLMVDKRLRDTFPYSEERRLAQALTTEILLGLDKDHKRRPLTLIYELGLINKDSPGLSMNHASLATADLREISLRDASLIGADLRLADLRGANLGGTDLLETNLMGAYLGGANIGWANLGEAHLEEADLDSAYLSGANLSGANLSGANLSGANLSGANLSGAIITKEQLLTCRSLEGTTIPDGRKYEDWLKGKEGNGAISPERPSSGRDYHRDISEFRGPTAPNASAEGAPISFLDIGQLLATYIGIPAVLLFPVGFLFYVLQIDMFYPFDFSTAWYATSLIPASVITGQGAKVLLVPLVVSLFIASIVGRTLIVRCGKRVRQEEKQDSGGPIDQENVSLPRRVLALLRKLPSALRKQLLVLNSQLSSVLRRELSLPIALTILILPLVGALSVVGYAYVTERASLIYWGLFVAIAALLGLTGGELILRSYYNFQGRSQSTDDEQVRATTGAERSLLLRGVKEKWIFKGLLVAYLGSVLTAFFIVFLQDALNQDPDLPHVEMNTPGQEIRDGLLLGHSDGYWHVIDTSSRDRDPRPGIHSFVIAPGNEVTNVRVFESPLDKADLDLGIDLGDKHFYWVGKRFTYTVEVKNFGPSRATNVVLDIYVPPSMRFIDAYQDGENLKCQTPEAQGNNENIDKTCPLVKELGRPVKGLGRPDTAKVKVVVAPTSDAKDEVYAFNAGVDGEEVDPDPYSDDVVKAKKRLKMDAKPPTTDAGSKVVGRGAYKPGEWTNRDVKVTLSATDHGGSGVRDITYFATKGGQEIAADTIPKPKVSFTAAAEGKIEVAAEGEIKVRYSAKDKVGNTTDKKHLIIKLDQTAPHHHCEKPGDRWADKDVSVRCTAKDEVSGLADSDDEEFTLSTNVPEDTETNDAQTGKNEVCDVAGNCTTIGPFDGIKVDKKAPEITITTPANNVEYTLHRGVEADYDCTDDGSGVGSCEGPVSDGNSLNTSSIGEKTFTVRATDESGNEATPETRTYRVIYDFRFLDPIEDPSAVYTVEAGDAVILPFGVEGYKGADIFAKGYPVSKTINCGSQRSGNTIESSNLRYDSDPNHYTYAWNTDEDWSDTCRRLTYKLNDGEKYSVTFRLI